MQFNEVVSNGLRSQSCYYECTFMNWYWNFLELIHQEVSLSKYFLDADLFLSQA